MKICPKCMGRHDDDMDVCPEDGTELRHIHSSSDDDDKMIGQVLDGRWVIEAKIGEGGMGAVYRGQQTSVGRQVAIKMLRGALADTDEYVERFFREANVASTLNHPHCVTIYDFGQDAEDHALYLAMEYLDGRELGELLHDDGLPLGDALTIGVQICSALAAAHRANIVHRDLKPDNIFLVDVPGGELFIKVLDFGIAKNLDAESPGVTRTGQIFGTPAYMSPEQCQSADVDPRSDLYSLGVILYELVSGRPPFGGETPLKTLLAHVSRQADPPSKIGCQVPAGVEAIIMRLLEKNPDDRFRDALEVREALEAQLQALSDDQLQSLSYDQIADSERNKQARATTGTLMFDELVADGGQDLVDLDQVQRQTAAYEEADSSDLREDDPIEGDLIKGDLAQESQEDQPNQPSQPTSASGSGLRWGLAAGLIILGVGATFFAMDEGPNPTPPPEPAVAPEPPREASSEPAPSVPAPSPEKLVALEIAADRIARAVDSGVQADKEAKAQTKTEQKERARPKKSAPAASSSSSKADEGSGPLVPVLTQAGARRIIASHNAEITACFEKGLLRDADFGGTVEVRMVIAADGSVANTDVVKSTVDAADVESCIVGRVKSWTFPETGDGRVKILTTPFRFQAPDVNEK